MIYYSELVDIFKNLTESHKAGITFTSDPSWIKNRGGEDVYPILVFMPPTSQIITTTDGLNSKDAYNISFLLSDDLSTDRSAEELTDTISNIRQIAKDIYLKFVNDGYDGITVSRGKILFSVTTSFNSITFMDDGMNLQAGVAVTFTIQDDVDNDCCFLDNFN